MIDKEWEETGIKDREGAKKYLSGYLNSSYLDYMGSTRAESAILNKSASPEYFSDLNEFEQFIEEWLSFKITP